MQLLNQRKSSTTYNKVPLLLFTYKDHIFNFTTFIPMCNYIYFNNQIFVIFKTYFQVKPKLIYNSLAITTPSIKGTMNYNNFPSKWYK